MSEAVRSHPPRDIPGLASRPGHAANVNVSERNSNPITIALWSVKLQLHLASQPGGVGDLGGLGDLGEICFNFFLLQPS